MGDIGWRPEGWDNAHAGYIISVRAFGVPGDTNSAFEAGADAMLEALKKVGYLYHKGEEWITLPENLLDMSKHTVNYDCWVIFIPDKGDK